MLDTLTAEPSSTAAATATASAAPAGRRLPRRDIILLPALSLLTVLCMLAGSEFVARAVWPLQEVDACRMEDPVTGTPRFRPNCSSRVKVPEGPWVDNQYNECGYRTAQSCGVKVAGTTRVAVLGTSFSYGYMTPYDQAYTTLATTALGAACSHPVEFQNLGFPNYTLVDVYHRLDEALALQPDLLLLAINPVDVRKEISADVLAHRNDRSTVKRASGPPDQGGWLRRTVIAPLRESRAMYVAQHFMFQDPETYLNLYLLYDDSAGYLRTPYSPAWQQRIANLDVILGDMSAKARAAAVPLAIMLGPQPSQVALVNTKPRAGIDPYAFSTAVRSVAAKYGIRVIDPLADMARRPDPMALFYVVDGHFGKQGQTILAQELERNLLAGGYATFDGCRMP